MNKNIDESEDENNFVNDNEFIDDEDDNNDIDISEFGYDEDEDESDEDDEVTETVTKVSKHKEKGKHALRYDSIFKGKKHEDVDNEHIIDIQTTFNADNETSNGLEQRDQVEYERLKKLQTEIHEVMVSMGKINIDMPRRKPSKVEFNRMFAEIVKTLDMDQYSYSEVFTLYAYNFSDNLENLFKLLDKEWGGKISLELKELYDIKGKSKFEDIEFM